MPLLFPLHPLGAGSHHVEALSSYLIRVAAVHAVSVGQLIHVVDAHRHGGRTAESKRLLAAPMGTYVRPNATAERVVDNMAWATGLEAEELRRTTFLALKASLDRSTHTFASPPKWCALCFADALADGEEPYLKLLWQLSDVDVCDVHRTKLVTRCPRCNGTQSGVGLRDSVAQCVRCRKLLLSQEQPSPRASWLWTYPDLLQLVAAIGSGEAVQFPERGVARAIETLFETAWATSTEVSLWRVVPRDACLRIAASDEPVTLLTARRFAAWLGVPLVALLEGQLGSTSGVLALGGVAGLPASLSPRRRTRSIDRTEIKARLDRHLRSVSAPPSLAAAARTVGSSVGALRYHLPAEVKKLTAEYAAWRVQCRERVAAAVRQAVESALHSEPARSRYVLLRELRRTTELPKHLLRAEIKRAYFARNHSLGGIGNGSME